MTAPGVELVDRLRPLARDLLRDTVRRLAHLAYADLRLEVVESKAASAENGGPKFSGDDYRFTLGVRVLAGDRAVAPGYVGLVLGAADLPQIERVMREALERAWRRATVNGEMKADARGKFGALGEALADLRLHPVEVREDVVPATYEIDPRSVALPVMVAQATDISSRLSALDRRIGYNHVGVVTQLSRELFASTEGALIDQAFALTQGSVSVVAVGDDNSQDLYDVMGH
ncbi:MAG TPA: TldD/PmbA family protein, partial [Methylomirabilota bacterium]|nr:TldD/PmbA family protein [Methylomirabilota bacterium]